MHPAATAEQRSEAVGDARSMKKHGWFPRAQERSFSHSQRAGETYTDLLEVESFVAIVVTFPTVPWDLSECYWFEIGEGVPLSGSPSRSAGRMYLTVEALQALLGNSALLGLYVTLVL